MGLILGGVAVAACLTIATASSAATLVGDYQLQGTRASSVGGSTLTDIGVGPNTFRSEVVMGVSRQVLTFPQGGGLQLSPSGLAASTDPYSEVLTFEFTQAINPPSGNGYARILNSSPGTLDNGLYDDLGAIDIYIKPVDHQGSPVLADNTYATVALVVGSSETRSFFNGTLQSVFAGGYPVVADTLQFFKDNEGGGEEADGAVSCIRVYRGALTDGEVAAIGASPTCGTTGQRAAALAKCKKKHRAAVKRKRAHDALTPVIRSHLKKKLRNCKRKARPLPV